MGKTIEWKTNCQREKLPGDFQVSSLVGGSPSKTACRFFSPNPPSCPPPPPPPGPLRKVTNFSAINSETTTKHGSLHYTPEHCLVSGGFPVFWWKKQHVSNCCNMEIFSGALLNQHLRFFAAAPPRWRGSAARRAAFRPTASTSPASPGPSPTTPQRR